MAGKQKLSSGSTRAFVNKSNLSGPPPLLPSRRDMQSEQNSKNVTRKNNSVLEVARILSTCQLNDTATGAIETSDNTLATVKKGLLWQRRNKRLFNRWKERYFILTTDYLACFDKSSSRVGHSEMGKFIYKLALNDVTKIEWLKPNKSDKGAVVIRLRGSPDLSLWSKDGLDDWMEALGETYHISSSRKTNITIQPLSLANEGHNSNHQDNCQTVAISNSTRTDRFHYREGGSRSPIDNLVVDQQQSEIIVPEQNSKHNLSLSQGSVKSRSQSSSGSQHASSNERTKTVSPPSTTMIVESSTIQSNPSTSQLASDDKEVGCDENSLRARDSLLSSTNFGSSEAKQLMRAKVVVGEGKNPASHRGDSRGPHSGVHQELGETNGNSGDHGTDTEAKNEIGSESSGRRYSQRKSHRNTNKLENSISRKDSSSHLNHMIMDHDNRESANVLTPKPERPNLIRRDNSWQSLVSLTRVGANSTQVVLRHRDPGHNSARPIPLRNRASVNEIEHNPPGLSDRQRRINIESTVTPLRGPTSLLRRQQSLQTGRQASPNCWQILGHSFDVPATRGPSTSQMIPPTPITPTASYHQKLMQLQMLHNANNVDYVRHSNDDQIYSTGPMATNHYSYYSMRSNLKSATTEFSFIRPIPSGTNSIKPYDRPETSGFLGPLQQRSTDHNRTSVVISSDENEALYSANDLNNNNIGPRPSFSGEISTDAMIGNQITLADLAAPTRELPLKPNKKRAPPNGRDGFAERKNAPSIAFNIASFFRRVFLRRSTRDKKKLKLGRSCTSSLDAFEQNRFPGAPLIQSAFSTGSKSVDQPLRQNVSVAQPQRMIDMIEAFANNAISDQSYLQKKPLRLTDDGFGQNEGNLRFHSRPSDRQLRPNPNSHRTPDLNDIGSENKQTVNRNQFGSLINKSTSISATMMELGGGHVIESNDAHGLEHDDHKILRRPGAHNVSQLESDSPLASRSMRVMSANLTPTSSRRDFLLGSECSQLGQMPRNVTRTGDPLPRPNSMYGQPSMISSSALSPRNDRASFALHRNSMHAVRNPSSYYEPPRRSHLIKTPFLSTTREVSEEVSTPVLEDTKSFDTGFHVMSDTFNDEMDAQFHRQAIVNPIFHSSTMDAIYDNHPLVRQPEISRVNPGRGGIVYSHYDNQRLESPPREQASSSEQFAASFDACTEMDQQLLVRSDRFQANIAPPRSSSYWSAVNHAYNPLASPMMIQNKPAAIVAPTTPSRELFSNDVPFRELADGTHNFGRVNYLNSASKASDTVTASVSPMASRRVINGHLPSFAQHSSLYQYSPLVSHQTRILKRSDGTQATIIGSQVSSDYAQPATKSTIIRPREGPSHSMPLDSGGPNSAADRPQNDNSVLRENRRDSQHDSFQAMSNKIGRSSNRNPLSRERSTSVSRSDNSSSERTSSTVGSNKSDAELRSQNGSRKNKSITMNTQKRASITATKLAISSRSNGTTSSHSSENGGHSPSTDKCDEPASRNDSIEEPGEEDWVDSKLIK